jgi:hypothetical protein
LHRARQPHQLWQRLVAGEGRDGPDSGLGRSQGERRVVSQKGWTANVEAVI